MKKILVVEDDDDILFMTQYILEKRGYIVFADNTGTNTHNIIANLKPDLIILDVRLPFKDGAELCKEVKAYSNIPVVLFSANTNISQILVESKADDFIPKPFEKKHLENIVAKHLV